jgi:DNA polymerase-3 subunit delta'
MIFPWQKKQWQQILQLRQQKRLPHAFLFSGIQGVGKKQLANTLAHALLCETPDLEGYSCGQCRYCHLIKAQSHPDFLKISPEESGQVIKIDQIREVIQFVNETALQGGYRVIIIDPANAMNLNAANALLKSLEEPTPNCLFILISNQSMRLLPTIKSRCQEIIFSKPDKTLALSWLNTQFDENQPTELLLNLTQGAPLKAYELMKSDFLQVRQNLYQGLVALSRKKIDPVQFAAQWQEIEFINFFDLLQNWLRDLMRFKLTRGEGELINIDFRAIYAEINPIFSLNNLIRYVDKVKEIQTKVLGSVSLNRQLILEELFISWVQHVSR